MTRAVLTEHAWNFSESANALQNVIANHPDNADALHHLAELLAILDLPEQAMDPAQKAANIATLAPIMLSSLGSYLRLQRNFERSAALYRKALLLDPNFRFALYGLCWSYVDLNQIADAKRVLTENLVPTDGKDGPNTDFCRAALASQAHNKAELSRLIAIAKKRFARGEHTAADVAFYYVLAGDKAESMSWFEKAYAETSNHQLLQFLWDPATKKLLRDDPRWAAFMERPLMKKWRAERASIAARFSAQR